MKRVLLVAAITIGLTAADGSAQVPVYLINLTGGPQTPDPQKPATSQKAILYGHVVDARTGEPIAKVKVIVSGTDQSTTTDENGAFTLENLPAGQVDLYITTVTFGLVKKTVTLKEGDNKDFQIALNEDAAALTEKVTIVDNPFQTTETSLASEQKMETDIDGRGPQPAESQQPALRRLRFLRFP